MKRSKIIEKFNEKVRSANNDNAIFNLKKYILLDDAIKIVNDVFSERQESTQTSEQHGSKALHIADVIVRLSDIEYQNNSFFIPKINERYNNVELLKKIEQGLDTCGYSIDYANIDDMGFLVIRFKAEELWEDSVINILKKDIKNVLNNAI